MTRFLCIIPLVLMTSAASAQQGQDACARDAQRFCRAYLDGGDQVVLACLKQNRARLSKGCQEVLTRHGQ
jgi:Cysteine rich repeat